MGLGTHLTKNARLSQYPGTLSLMIKCSHPFLTVAWWLMGYLTVYSIAQASRAVIPKDTGGPWGQRIGVTVANGLHWALRVGAYQTKRLSPSDWNKYSLVVLNWDDSAS